MGAGGDGCSSRGQRRVVAIRKSSRDFLPRGCRCKPTTRRPLLCRAVAKGGGPELAEYYCTSEEPLPARTLTGLIAGFALEPSESSQSAFCASLGFTVSYGGRVSVRARFLTPAGKHRARRQRQVLRNASESRVVR